MENRKENNKEKINKVRSFFDRNKSIVEGISNLVMISIVIITIINVTSTYKMAKVAEKECRPYISIEDFHKVFENNKVSFEVVIENKGNTPARIDNIKLEILDERFFTIERANDFLEEFLLNPNQRTTYNFLGISNLEEFPEINLYSRIKIEYNNLSDRKNKKRYCIEYLFNFNKKIDEKAHVNNVRSCE